MGESHPLAREAVLSAAIAALAAAVLAWFGPPGTDFAAHAYQRTLFLQHGFTLWNNFWYAGRYSFITYSILYYPLAGLLGIRLLAVATVALAALAFAVVLWREWGPTTRWSSRSFAVVWAGIVLSAAFPFALGIALALLALWALQSAANGRFAALAMLSLAASPLAFLFLVIVLVGVALAQRVSIRGHGVPLTSIALAGLAELLLWRLFPGGGRFPFHLADALAAVAFCLLGLTFTWHVAQARIIRFVFAVYLAATVVSYLVPSEVGGNIERLRFAAIPLAVLVFSLRRWRPLLAGLAVLALALVWNLSTLAASYQNGQADVTAKPSVWPAAVSFLQRHLTPSYRVEAVDTTDHWPADYLAAAGIPLARGWFRQDDFPQNQVLYSRLGAHAYLHWLRSLGVRYIVLTDAPPDYSARAEAKLLRSRRAGLPVVFRTSRLTIYEVARPRPIITGPRSPTLVALTQQRIRLTVHQGGDYRIAVRWSPYWRASNGCLRRGSNGMLRLETRSPHHVTLVFRIDTPHALAALTGQMPTCTLGSRQRETPTATSF